MSSTAIYATPIRRSTVEKALIYMVRQYWREVGQPDKYKIFARWTSFHGNTTGALHWGGQYRAPEALSALISADPA